MLARLQMLKRLQQNTVHQKAVPEALLQVGVAQLHDHAGGSNVVDGVQNLLQLLEGDWGLVQLLMQVLNLFFQFLQATPGKGTVRTLCSLTAGWNRRCTAAQAMTKKQPAQ